MVKPLDVTNLGLKAAQTEKYNYDLFAKHIEGFEEQSEMSLREYTAYYLIPYIPFYKLCKKYSDKSITRKANGKSRRSVVALSSRKKIPSTELACITNMYVTDLMSLEEIGRKYDVTAVTVMTYLKSHGVVLRSKSEIMRRRIENTPNYSELMRDYSTKGYLSRRQRGTKPELHFKTWLQNNNVVYVEQYRKVGNAHPYDFFLPEHNLLVEIDGHYWHSKPEQQIKDTQHVEDAISKGYKIVRICTKELEEHSGDYTKWICLN